MEDSTQLFPNDGTPPPYEPQRKKRGCVFYGCLGAIILAVLGVILLGVGVALTYRAVNEIVKQFGEDEPRPVPVTELPVEELDAVKARVAKFENALVTSQPTEPLILTAPQINALIDADPDFKGIVAVDFDDNKIRGQVSFPLDRITFFGKPLFPGKFINGIATFDVRIDNGVLLITLDTLEVKGKPISEDAMATLRQENWAKGTANNPKAIQQISQIDSIIVKNGKLIITPKVTPKIIEDEPKPTGKIEVKPDEPKPAEPKPIEPKPAETKPEPAKKAA